MRVLGIDPGSRFLGYGVVEERQGRMVHVGHGVIRAPANGALEQRLCEIFLQLEAALALYLPQAVAVEGVFTLRNARSALVLGHARGVALLAAAQRGLPVYEYAPARVKRAVGAGGGGAKGQVSKMVQTLLNLGVFERADASDALAIAICHLNSARWPLGTTRSSKKSAAAEGLLHRLAPAYRKYGAPS